MVFYRKYIISGIVILFVCLLAYLCYEILNRIQHKGIIETNIKKIPKFTAKLINDSEFSTSNLKANTPTIIIFLNTECEYCQYEAKEIAKYQADFEEVNLLMISSEEIGKIKAFMNNYQLSGFVKPLQMDVKTITNTFGAVSIPNIFIYGKDHRLIKQSKGETKVESILKHIK